MGEDVSRSSTEPENEESILSAVGLGIDRDLPSEPQPGPQKCARTLHVLTLTPFYPSIEDPAQGGFISDPLTWTAQLGVSNEVIAVRPFYKGRVHEQTAETPCQWTSYLSIPGNLGLLTAGAFMAKSLMREVRKRHRSWPFDLIHAHAALPCGQAAAILAAKLGIPFVVTVHGLDAFATRQTGKVLSRWSRQASGTVYRRARAVICISEKVREQVVELEAVNTVVIHNGVDAQMFTPVAWPTAALTVLSVGNLIEIKGHAVLLRAFAHVLKVVPDCRLEIIGEGSERENLVRLAETLRIAPRVRFRGRQNRKEVANAMKQCAVFALPSRYEGFGCVYLEAMAAGKPAIACTGQGISEVIEHGKTGMLVEPENEIELARALQTLLQNEDFRRRMGDSARNAVVERHTLLHQAESLIRVYRECAR